MFMSLILNYKIWNLFNYNNYDQSKWVTKLKFMQLIFPADES